MDALGYDVADEIREVTDEECDSFRRAGWARLPGLISKECAARLLRQAKEWMGDDGDSHELRANDLDIKMFKDFHDPSKAGETFREIVLSRELGRNAARLLGRDMSMRHLTDEIAVKLPVESGRGSSHVWHQDGRVLPFDLSTLDFWIALDEIQPEQGPLQFRTGSHELGPLGPFDGFGGWPRLEEFPPSPLERMEPGDATAHNSWVVHISGENRTPKPRWALIAYYFPADARYSTLPFRLTDGLGLKAFEHLDRPEFPIVYEGSLEVAGA